MEKDSIKENETEEYNDKTNEIQHLTEKNDELKEKKVSFGKEIFANLLDQLIILSASSIILLIVDLVMKVFGYQFVRENGVLISVIMCVYFVINCFYTQLFEKTKLKNTIAKKLLNV